MTDRIFNEIRSARNSYNSAMVAAKGFVSGQRVYALREAEKRLREILWKHRDQIAELGEKIG